MKGRTCTKCKKYKSFDNFVKKADKPGKYYSWCKACQCEKNRKKYKDWKSIILKKLGIDRCSRCGYNKFLGALDFHHEGDDKEFNISRNYSIDRSLKEAKKCIVVCANCHREIQYMK